MCFDFNLEVPSGVHRKPGLLLQQLHGFVGGIFVVIIGIFVVFVGILCCNDGINIGVDFELEIPSEVGNQVCWWYTDIWLYLLVFWSYLVF